MRYLREWTILLFLSSSFVCSSHVNLMKAGMMRQTARLRGGMQQQADFMREMMEAMHRSIDGDGDEMDRKRAECNTVQDVESMLPPRYWAGGSGHFPHKNQSFREIAKWTKKQDRLAPLYPGDRVLVVPEDSKKSAYMATVTDLKTLLSEHVPSDPCAGRYRHCPHRKSFECFSPCKEVLSEESYLSRFYPNVSCSILDHFSGSSPDQLVNVVVDEEEGRVIQQVPRAWTSFRASITNHTEQEREALVSRFLQAASDGEDEEILTLVERHHVPIEAWDRTMEGQRAVHFAASGGHLEVLGTLRKLGAEMTAMDFAGRTALHTAAMKGNVEAVELLVRMGLDPNEQDGEGMTAIHYAASCFLLREEGGGKTVRALLMRGGNSSLVDREGQTPLHAAASFGNVKACQALLEAGAKQDVKDKKSQRPVDLTDEEEILKLLNETTKKDQVKKTLEIQQEMRNLMQQAELLLSSKLS